MTDPHLDALRQDLQNRLVSGIGITKAVEMLIADQRRQFSAYPDLLQDRLASLETARHEYEERLNRVEYLKRRSVRDGREMWYAGPSEHATVWNGLRNKLLESGRDVDQVNDESDTVVGLLGSPDKESFTCKGLVVGHVQSGKTGNMAAVIAKASDTKYKFFVILASMTDQLRDQTQRRLDDDVVGMAPDRWYRWTSADVVDSDGRRISGDFSEKAAGGFVFDQRNQIAVIKKNSAPLRKLLAKIQNTDRSSLRDTPFLIIDDEADQASVNSARYNDEVTVINDLIRRIIESLPRVSYVGYTATPFANILIDTTAPKDLYPRDFIHALETPTGYFGAERLFGKAVMQGAHDDEEAEPGFDMIRIVPDADAAALRAGHGAPSVPDSLTRAMQYFLLVIAARAARGQQKEHTTMLVHTSVNTGDHERLRDLVKPLVARLVSGLQVGDSVIIGKLRDLWQSENERVLSERFDLTSLDLENLTPHLHAAAESIEVIVENYLSDDRLSFKGQGRNQIVIGGNVLARGLTLEGLSVSYFLRSSNQYDTLMQMGRWFGYRKGYEDLPRVWVEDRVRQRFLDLSKVEAEIRAEIRRYAEEGATPTDFAVKIRKIPGMAITAKTKMRHAVNVSIDFEGEHVQTTRFKRRDKVWLAANWAAAARLVDACASDDSGRDGDLVFKGVRSEAILSFLGEYSAHESHRHLAPSLLKKYVEDRSASDPRYAKWTVAVIRGDGAASELPLGLAGHVTTVIRGALKGEGEDANIKALMSWSDVLVDIPLAERRGVEKSWAAHKALRHDAGRGPLLLLYPIEALSNPTGNSKPDNRQQLRAKLDVMGIGIVFAGRKATGTAYVSANLEPEDAAAADETESVYGAQAGAPDTEAAS
jgi:hypothetical protein